MVKKVPQLYIRLLGFILCCASFIMLISITSFNPNDPSGLIYYATPIAPTNMLGSFGAWLASWLIALCDIGAFFFIASLFCLGVSLVQFHPSTTYRDFFIGLLGLGVCCSSTAAFYKTSYYVSTYLGGFLGRYHISLLHYLFDDFLIFIWLIIIATSSLLLLFDVIILRLSTILVQYYSFFIAQKPLRYVIYKSCTMLKTSFRFFLSIIDGSFVKSTPGGVISFEQIVQEVYAHEWEEQQLQLSSPAQAVQNSPEEAITLATSTNLEETVSHPSLSSREIKSSSSPYTIPLSTLFSSAASSPVSSQQQEYQHLAERLEKKLERFGIQGSVIKISPGPVITFFEYKPHIDAKVSKILALEDDLALALEALSVRIIAPVPGTPIVGFEVANKDREVVNFADIVRTKEFNHNAYQLALALGQDVKGEAVIVDLISMPHLLVAGSTGSGKSVILNVILASLLCKYGPEKLRLILIDPKRLEFSAYADIPHLLTPVVTDTKKALGILKWVINTMQERYQIMEACGVKSIHDYNRWCAQNQEEILPHIVIIIDELADLIMTVGKDIEEAIVRIAQMARAAGIHMIVATQRPSVDVVTGVIKVNFPSRIACRVASKVDSRTILDVSGAHKLLGRGDMLFLMSNGQLKRVHGAYITDQELHALINKAREYGSPAYVSLEVENIGFDSFSDLHAEDEELYTRILSFLPSVETISVSLLQRTFRIGYNRSARIVDRLQAEGFITHDGTGKLKRVVRS